MRGFYNEKKNGFKIILFCFIVFCVSSCSTTGTGTDVIDTITGNSYAAGQLEATITELDRTTASSRERIEAIIGTSRNIENGIERVEYLFGQYESEVNRLLNEIDTIREQIELQSEDNKDSDNLAYYIHSSACCSNCLKSKI